MANAKGQIVKRTTKWAAVAATAVGLVLGGGSFALADIKIGNRSQFSQTGESSSLGSTSATTTSANDLSEAEMAEIVRRMQAAAAGSAP